MIIRKAKIGDLEAIRELNRKLFEQDFGFDDTLDVKWPDYDTSTGVYRKDIEDNDHLTQVAEENGAIVGYMVCEKMKTPSWMRQDLVMAELDHTFIDADFRGKNIGSEMVANFEKWAKLKGCNLIIVTASAKNGLAHGFYKKAGFKETDITFQKKI